MTYQIRPSTAQGERSLTAGVFRHDRYHVVQDPAEVSDTVLLAAERLLLDIMFCVEHATPVHFLALFSTVDLAPGRRDSQEDKIDGGTMTCGRYEASDRGLESTLIVSQLSVMLLGFEFLPGRRAANHVAVEMPIKSITSDTQIHNMSSILESDRKIWRSGQRWAPKNSLSS